VVLQRAVVERILEAAALLVLLVVLLQLLLLLVELAQPRLDVLEQLVDLRPLRVYAGL